MYKAVSFWAAILLSLSAIAGCVSLKEPDMIRTDTLLPAVSPTSRIERQEFPVVFERFIDERSDRSTVGTRLGYGGPTPVIADRNIVDVFEKIVLRAFENKGVRQGASPLALKGNVKSASVGNLPQSNSVRAQVALELVLTNVAQRSRLWSRTYTGEGIGANFETTLSGAFQDLSASLEKDDSILQVKPTYLALVQGPVKPAGEEPAPTDGVLVRELQEIAAFQSTPDPNRFAVVMGVEKYRDINGVEYAAADARLVRAYLNRLLGYPEENIALLLNDRATRTDLEKFLGPWLKNRVNEQSQVFVYYAGHGAPDPKTGEAFIVPYDGDPNYLGKTGYPLRDLYAALSDLPAKRIIVALDACFSGAGGRSVIAKGARPLVISQQKSAPPGDHLVILSAASGAQISTSSDLRKHGLFTYYLLQGLRGEADPQKTGAITVGHLFQYVRANVEREARRQNVEQTPMLHPTGQEIESLRLR